MIQTIITRVTDAMSTTARTMDQVISLNGSEGMPTVHTTLLIMSTLMHVSMDMCRLMSIIRDATMTTREGGTILTTSGPKVTTTTWRRRTTSTSRPSWKAKRKNKVPNRTHLSPHLATNQPLLRRLLLHLRKSKGSQPAPPHNPSSQSNSLPPTRSQLQRPPPPNLRKKPLPNLRKSQLTLLRQIHPRQIHPRQILPRQILPRQILPKQILLRHQLTLPRHQPKRSQLKRNQRSLLKRNRLMIQSLQLSKSRPSQKRPKPSLTKRLKTVTYRSSSSTALTSASRTLIGTSSLCVCTIGSEPTSSFRRSRGTLTPTTRSATISSPIGRRESTRSFLASPLPPRNRQRIT